MSDSATKKEKESSSSGIVKILLIIVLFIIIGFFVTVSVNSKGVVPSAEGFSVTLGLVGSLFKLMIGGQY